MKKLGTLLLTGGILLALASPAYAQRPAETEAIGAGTPAPVVAAEEQAEAAALSDTNGVVASGNCGEEGNESSLTWTLDDTGTLTIGGTGEMKNYDYLASGLVPWSSWRDLIVSVRIEEGVTNIGDTAFYECGNLTEITIPDSVTSIGKEAFFGCSSLTKITIPNSVTDIGEYAFCECSSLTEIAIPESVTDIGFRVFQSCSSLTEIKIPDGIISIGDGMFFLCSSLTDIVIPNSVTSVEDYAFDMCSNLTGITIPKSVTSIGVEAFYGCSSLTDVYYDGTKEQWKAISIRAGNEYLTSATIHFSADSDSGTGGSTSGGSSSSSGSSGGSGGCYVATAIYGSYDCPEVWTLRRYRDYELSQTAAGRAFVRTYYAVSPTIVEHFGDEEWFQDMWRGPLDKMVSDLQAKGYESTPYEDIEW